MIKLQWEEQKVIKLMSYQDDKTRHVYSLFHQNDMYSIYLLW